MTINELIDNRHDIYDSDFDESNLSDSEQDKAIESMVEAGYSVGMLKTFERVYWAPEK